MKVLVKNTFYGGFNLEIDGAKKIENPKVRWPRHKRVARSRVLGESGRKLYRADLKARKERARGVESEGRIRTRAMQDQQGPRTARPNSGRIRRK